MTAIHDKIIKFLMTNPHPKDEAIHSMGEKLGIEPDRFEEQVYMILGELITGGRSKGFNGKYDPKELKMGIAVEAEHTNSKLIAEKIAKDHLAEIPDYYTRLKKMESEVGITEGYLREGSEPNATGFDIDIEKRTLDNEFFREVLFTGKNAQLVVMSVKDEIGVETHKDVDQFFRIEGGTGKVIINGREFPVESKTSFIVPQGSKHNVVNTGKGDLKLYSIYSPPHHRAGTIHKTRQEAMADKEDEVSLKEAGFEEKPRGWDKASLNKYMATFTKRMKGGAKAEGFFDKCVEKIKDKVDNPEGFCASLKDEAYGSTGWRGKDKPPKEVSKDVKKAKFKVESEQAINDYLDFISEGDQSVITEEGAVLPNELIHMLEYDERPNWIGNCIRKYDGEPNSQIKCLQAVKEYAAANPFYQYRIDRYIDRIMDNWDGMSDVPYPTQNPDSREVKDGSYEKGYSNMDHETPGIVESDSRQCEDGYKWCPMKEKCVKDGQGKGLKETGSKTANENFPDMSGGGGMGCRLPPADTMETEEMDEDDVVHPPMNWSRKKGRSDRRFNDTDVIKDKRLPISVMKKGVSK